MYRQGDIVLIPFPYSDLSTTKQRPVLVLSNTNYNKMQSDLVVAAITSNLTSKIYTIQITAADLDEGLLRAPSAVRADKVYTFSNQIVIKKFGHLKPSSDDLGFRRPPIIDQSDATTLPLPYVLFSE